MKWISVSIILMGYLADGDPSMKPSFDDNHQIRERFRFLADFDNDGDIDMLLSHPTSGMASGGFTLYLRDGFDLNNVGCLSAHYMGVALEHTYNTSRIWVYLRGSCGSGKLGFYELSKGKLHKFKGIGISAGDGGTDLGNSLCKAVFSSKYRLVAERSETVGNSVKWKKL